MKPLVDTVSPKANSQAVEKQLNGGGSNKEADQRDDQITQTTGQAVVEIRQRTSHYPKREGDGELHIIQPPRQSDGAAEGDKDPDVIQPVTVPRIATKQGA